MLNNIIIKYVYEYSSDLSALVMLVLHAEKALSNRILNSDY